MLETGRHIVLGNIACAEGALRAGCRFFAGYPITPASEISHHIALELPKVGGVFLQMEDEIASIASTIGASWAGAKSMTATSGPGYSLMMENIGYAHMTETPCVIVNVQRSGPSTGQATLPGQQDIYQAKRYGDLFHAEYALLISLEPLQEEIKRLHQQLSLLNRFQGLQVARKRSKKGKPIRWRVDSWKVYFGQAFLMNS